MASADTHEDWVSKVRTFLCSDEFQWLVFRRPAELKVKLLNDTFTVRIPDYIALSRVNSRHFRSLSKLKRTKYFLNLYYVPRTRLSRHPVCFGEAKLRWPWWAIHESENCKTSSSLPIISVQTHMELDMYSLVSGKAKLFQKQFQESKWTGFLSTLAKWDTK